MNVEQELVREIRTLSNVETLCRLCNKIEDPNKLISIPISDGSSHTFATTFLSLAISCDNVDAVDLLLQKGADPNFTNNKLLNDGPLLYNLSIFTGSTAEEVKKKLMITKLMLDYGANPNQVIPKEGKTVYQFVKEIASSAYDPSSDYDYRFDAAFLELLEAGLQESLNQIDMESLLSSFDD